MGFSALTFSQGPQGPQGVSGYSGVSGIIGISGYSGVSGFSGTSNPVTNIAMVSANYAMTTADDLVINTGSNITVTLPLVSSLQIYYIQNSGTGAMTLIPSDSATINGFANLILAFNGSSCVLASTGSNYVIF